MPRSDVNRGLLERGDVLAGRPGMHKTRIAVRSLFGRRKYTLAWRVPGGILWVVRPWKGETLAERRPVAATSGATSATGMD